MEAQLEHRTSRIRLYLTILTFLALLLLVYKLRAQIVDALDNLTHIHSIVLLAIVPIQFFNYSSYSLLYKSLYETLSEKVHFWSMFRLSLELNLVNQILPSGGVSGISYFALRARAQEGISVAKSTLVMVIKMILLYISFQPLLILGLVFLSIGGRVNDVVIMVASALITLVTVGTLLGMYIIGDRRRIRKFLTMLTRFVNKLVHLVRWSRPETINIERAQSAFDDLHTNYNVFKNNWISLKKPFFLTMAANATEIATLYVVYIAFGEYVNLGAVILAYAVANFAGIISVLPAGIGIYEGLMTAVLAASGIPAELSIPVTITYRIVSLFLQLTPGYILYQKAIRSKGI